MQFCSDNRRLALLLISVLIISDLSMASQLSAQTTPEVEEYVMTESSPAIIIDGLPPLMCPNEGGESPCNTPNRNIDAGGLYTEETPRWWLEYSPDRDSNGMDDRLQRIIAGQYESVSTTAIIGEDGRKTVAIYVDYAWHPTEEDIASLMEVLISHGWSPPQGIEGDAHFAVLQYVDAIAVDHVPVGALFDIWSLEGVVVVEMQDVYAPFLSNSVRAIKARASDTYQQLDAPHSNGIIGSGVVVAILDTGVDNEHRSLNDFDDIDDEPDSDAGSYDDQKWVAGYDATSTFSQTDGSEDPDDGDGHGTHVAGTAIGTGDYSRVNVGVAPGAYLVDVKVLTDAGGTNSQYTAQGIQWIIQNVETDWGNNESSEGIQIASMSFGTFNAIDQDDPGDNGSSVNARLVNDAVEAGILCVIAIGNNGVRQVPSPASADLALVVGAVDDSDTVTRDDDEIASYSNYGPREDDGDDDEWDELKPDVVAPGSDIDAPLYAAGSLGGLPGETTMADDGYQELTGTSMSTPHVSGIAALILQQNPELMGKPLEIRDIFRNNTVLPDGVSATEPDITDKWNDKWGFGYVDVESLLGEVEGGGGPLPQGDGAVNITSPVNGSWIISEFEHRIRGTSLVEINEGQDANTSISLIQVNLTSPNSTADNANDGWKEWVDANGTTDWLYDFVVPSNIHWNSWFSQCSFDGEHWYGCINIRVRGLDSEGRVIGTSDYRHVRLGYFDFELDEPSPYSPISGDVTFEGTYDGVQPDKVQYKVSSGEWVDGDIELSGSTSDEPTQESGEWSFVWDSTEIFDGLHEIQFRLLNRSGVLGGTLNFDYEIDNLPLAPDLAFYAEPVVQIQGLLVDEAYVNSILTISVEIVNNGDAAAGPSDITVVGAGAEQTLRIDGFEIGEVRTVEIPGWAPSVLGEGQTITIYLDSAGDLSENYPDNNQAEIQFDIVERNEGVDLSLSAGSVQIRNAQEQFIVPRPYETFYMHVTVDNLGTENSGSAHLSLEMKTSDGWEFVGEQQIVNVFANGGREFISPFELRLDELGAHNFRLTISNNSADVSTSNNQIEFSIIVDDVQLGANVTIPLRDDETALGFSAAGGAGHLLTTYDGELHIRTISPQLQTLDDILVDASFSGEATIISNGDESHIVWTRRALDETNYIRMTVSHAVVFENGDISQVNDLLEPIRLSQGTYFGLGIAVSGSDVAIAGYHRDISTSGTFQDITSVFLLTSKSPLDADSWDYSGSVVFDIELQPDEADPVCVVIGPESYHVLYQAERDDSTGIVRLGLFYAKGEQSTGIWSFQAAVGDYASSAQMELLVNSDDESVLVAAWREGSGDDAQLVSWVTNHMWSADDRLYTSAPGMEHLDLVRTEDGVQVFYDAVLLGTNVILYGVLSDSDASDSQSLSVRLSKGQLIDASRGDDGTNMVYLTSSEIISVRPLVEGNTGPPEGETWWQRLQNRLPNDSASSLLIQVVGLAMLSLFIVLTINSVGTRIRRRRALKWVDVSEEVVVKLDVGEEVELLELESDEIEVTVPLEIPEPEVVPEEIEIEPLIEEPDPILFEDDSDLSGAELRRKRRLQRKMERELSELPPLDGLSPIGTLPIQGLGDLPPMPLPDLDLGELPPLDGGGFIHPLGDLPPLKLDRDVACDECGAVFTLRDMQKRRMRCPMCSANVVLED